MDFVHFGEIRSGKSEGSFVHQGCTTGGRRTGGPGWWFVTEVIMPHVSLIRL